MTEEPCPDSAAANERLARIEERLRGERDSRVQAFAAHALIHTEAAEVRKTKDEQLNEVRLRFISREVFETSMRAVWGLMIAIILLLLANLGALIGILATK